MPIFRVNVVFKLDYVVLDVTQSCAETEAYCQQPLLQNHMDFALLLLQLEQKSILKRLVDACQYHPDRIHQKSLLEYKLVLVHVLKKWMTFQIEVVAISEE